MFDTSISVSAYKRLTSIIYQHSRIFLGSNKQQLVVSRLAKRLRDLELPSYDDYCNYLNGGQNEDEMGLMIDLISTNHTHFFRESVHFDLLQTQILPELFKKHPEARHNLKCWSAASSSGEEPYTLAIMLAEFSRTQGGMQWEIHASDISNRMLETAKTSIYDESKLNIPQPEWFGRYFKVGSGPYAGKCKVRDELRQRVSFLRINLFDPHFPIPENQHIIFCRNVLIYFDKTSQQQLIERLYNQLAVDGCLIIGHSESLLNLAHTFKPLGNGIYRRAR